MRRGYLFCIFAALFSAQVHAASQLKTLQTGDESRAWHAVGRLNFGSVSFCTGALIAEDLVLTAAHCMFDPDTGQRLDDGQIEFLADWRGGRASAYRSVRRSIIHPSFTYSSDNFVSRVAHDVAILELDTPIRNGTIVPFDTATTAHTGDEVGVVSYAIDRADAPSLQEVCHVLDQRGGSLVLSCDVDFGSSGAPIFVIENGIPKIVSVVSAKAEMGGTPVALGMTLANPLSELMALRNSSASAFSRTQTVAGAVTDTDSSGSGAKFVRP
ncbi:MAG: trypsin-like serine protease [Pseudomonadota bacterium]